MLTPVWRVSARWCVVMPNIDGHEHVRRRVVEEVDEAGIGVGGEPLVQVKVEAQVEVRVGRLATAMCGGFSIPENGCL